MHSEKKRNRGNLLVKGFVAGLRQLVLFAAFLIVPAGLLPNGTWLWERGLQFLAIYGVFMEVSIIILFFIAPDNLEGRLKSPFNKKQSKQDRKATLLVLFTIALWFVFIPIDVFALKLFQQPSFVLSIFGLIIFLLGYSITAVTVYQNPYAITYVEDQTKQGQYLVDTGVYRIVRHPMYMGSIIFFLGIALWLGSFAALFAVPLIALSMIPRITEEEKTLTGALNGYKDYKKKVKYRIVPFVW